MINATQVAEESVASPKGAYAHASRNLSLALGRQPFSTDMLLRHPFDVEICRIPAGKKHCPYHSHSMQWEFYHVQSGRGHVRTPEGLTAIGAGDAFLFRPGEPHQILAADDSELVVLIVADNPLGESCHYPDSDKWLVRSPERRLIRSESLDYFNGEE